MDLTHLDDVQPPTPDAAMRSRVVKTARSRRHVRVALESGTALVVAVAIIIAGVASTRGPSHQVRVAITAPPTSTTVARGDVTVRIELDHDTVAPGGTIHGTLVFDNPRPRAVAFSGGTACVERYQVDVGTHTQDANQGWPQDCLSVGAALDAASARHALAVQHLAVPSGITRVPFSIDDVQLVGAPQPSRREFVYFVVEGGTPPGLVAPAPVPITIK